MFRSWVWSERVWTLFQAWRDLSHEDRQVYYDIAKSEAKRFQEEMTVYNQTKVRAPAASRIQFRRSHRDLRIPSSLSRTVLRRLVPARGPVLLCFQNANSEPRPEFLGIRLVLFSTSKVARARSLVGVGRWLVPVTCHTRCI